MAKKGNGVQQHRVNSHNTWKSHNIR